MAFRDGQSKGGGQYLTKMCSTCVSRDDLSHEIIRDCKILPLFIKKARVKKNAIINTTVNRCACVQ